MSWFWVFAGRGHHIASTATGRSLCGKWGFLSDTGDYLPACSMVKGLKDCGECVKRWNKMYVVKQQN